MTDNANCSKIFLEIKHGGVCEKQAESGLFALTLIPDSDHADVGSLFV